MNSGKFEKKLGPKKAGAKSRRFLEFFPLFSQDRFIIRGDRIKESVCDTQVSKISSTDSCVTI